MNPVIVLVLVVAVGAAAALVAMEYSRRRFAAEPVHDAVTAALAELRSQSVAERDAAVRAALEQAAVLQRE